MIQVVCGCKQSRLSDIDENAMLVRIRASAGSFTKTKATSHTVMPCHRKLGSFTRTDILRVQREWFEPHLSVAVREGLHKFIATAQEHQAVRTLFQVQN
jgi:hypothetical protein